MALRLSGYHHESSPPRRAFFLCFAVSNFKALLLGEPAPHELYLRPENRLLEETDCSTISLNLITTVSAAVLADPAISWHSKL